MRTFIGMMIVAALVGGCNEEKKEEAEAPLPKETKCINGSLYEPLYGDYFLIYRNKKQIPC